MLFNMLYLYIYCNIAYILDCIHIYVTYTDIYTMYILFFNIPGKTGIYFSSIIIKVWLINNYNVNWKSNRFILLFPLHIYIYFL
jgi:hypothetical protein